MSAATSEYNFKMICLVSCKTSSESSVREDCVDGAMRGVGGSVTLMFLERATVAPMDFVCFVVLDVDAPSTIKSSVRRTWGDDAWDEDAIKEVVGSVTLMLLERDSLVVLVFVGFGVLGLNASATIAPGADGFFAYQCTLLELRVV